MAISSIGNQGQIPMAGVEKSAVADPFKHKAQASKPAESTRVSISSEAQQKVRAEKEAEQKSVEQKAEAQKAAEQKQDVKTARHDHRHSR